MGDAEYNHLEGQTDDEEIEETVAVMRDDHEPDEVPDVPEPVKQDPVDVGGPETAELEMAPGAAADASAVFWFQSIIQVFWFGIRVW